MRLLILFFIAFLQTSLCFAQNKRNEPEEIMIYNPQIVLKTNPLLYFQGSIPLAGEFNLIGELTFTPNHSVEIGASYLYNGVFLSFVTDSLNNSGNPQNLRFEGYRIQGAYRFYLNSEKENTDKAAPYGWFISPRYNYAFARVNENVPSTYNSTLEITQIFFDLRFGKSMAWGSKFSFEIFGGLGYKNNTWREFSTQTPPQGEEVDISDIGLGYSSNVKYTLGFNFGYHFNL